MVDGENVIARKAGCLRDCKSERTCQKASFQSNQGLGRGKKKKSNNDKNNPELKNSLCQSVLIDQKPWEWTVSSRSSVHHDNENNITMSSYCVPDIVLSALHNFSLLILTTLVSTIIIPILQLKTLRLREIEHAQIYMNNRW